MFEPNEGLLELSEVNGAVETGSTAVAPLRTVQAERRYGFIPREKFDNLNRGDGLRIQRYFTQPGVDPFDPVEWEHRTAVIAGERGEVVFEQKDVEVPAFWSQLATNVVASKYFRGQVGTPEREHSVRQVIGRVVETLTRWGREMDYFASEQDAEAFRDELKHLLLYQYASFNSPVWFNVGIEPRPQSSACFIVSVEDTMESILDLAKTEGMIFKFGSGSGSNLSRIRGSKEFLSGGGRASGPVSFMRGFDAFAGVIKSGGKTRRAAKMVVLNIDHPDIVDFIECKAKEEKKAWALIEEGYDPGFDTPGGAYDSVFFQNANHSVRVTDEFMRAVEQDGEWCTYARTTGEVMGRYRARELFRKIAEAAWVCGDPGLQFHDTTNKWHTVKNSGPIEASNPCFTGESLVYTNKGLIRFRDLMQRVNKGESFLIYTHNRTAAHPQDGVQLSEPVQWMITGVNEVWRLRFSNGIEVRCTPNHRFFTLNRGMVRADELTPEDVVLVVDTPCLPTDASWRLPVPADWKQLRAKGERHAQLDLPTEWSPALAELLGHLTGDGSFVRSSPMVIWVYGGKEEQEQLLPRHRAMLESLWLRPHLSQQPNGTIQMRVVRAAFSRFLESLGVSRAKAHEKRVPESIFQAPPEIVAAYLRGLFTADGCARDDQKKGARYVGLGSKSLTLLQQVQQLLLMFGIQSRIYTQPPKKPTFRYTRKRDGQPMTYESKGGTYDLRITGPSIRRFYDYIGFALSSKQQTLERWIREHEFYAVRADASLVEREFDGYELTYNLTEPLHHSYIVNGLVVANCSEFVFLNDTSCNLASLNLMKFRLPDGRFDVEAFRAAVRILITAQEIIVDNSAYPTERICDNSHNFRPLGLGYANLGALLMSLGLPYDSDAGRAYAAVITALMHGEAYRQSAIIARDCGAPFPGFALNREPMLEVMRMHADALNQIQSEYVPDYMLQTAREIYREMLQLGEQYGYRNAQVTVLAPTGCLVGHSLVATEYGLVRLRTLGNPAGEQWQEVDFMVATDEEPQKATKFYINGVAPTRLIRTRSGYTIQGTPNHQIKVIDAATGERVWRRLDAIRPGDIVPLRLNSLFGAPREVPLPPLGDLHWNAEPTLRVPRHVTPELAELVGYYMGDGSLHAKGLRFCVSSKDTDVAERIRHLCRILFGLEPQITKGAKGDYLEIVVHAVPLAIWWEACSFMKHKPNDAHRGKGFTPHIPDAILRTNDPLIYCAFLRGLFEADGSVIGGVPSLTTASETFANEIRSLLLALGYPTKTKVDCSAWGQGTLYVLRLRNRAYNEAFLREIGFLGQRKSGAVVRDASKMPGKGDRVYLPLSLVRELVPPTSRHYGAVYLALKRHGGIPRERVLQLLHETGDRRLWELLQFYYDPVVANEDGGLQPTYDLSVPANLTYIANGFVSHNTISFMMDCDTTGIEPDIALVKYKTLVGGGMLKIVNTTVPLALQQLGYSPEQIEAITRYIDEHDTIEGAPYLKEEHLPVFDCAFRPAKGTRSLAPMAHVKMMAAVQPFLSGAISKTVNVPNDATPEDIEQIYMQAWKRGLKAIAIYRDGSKRTQPLSTKKPSEQEAQLPVPTERPVRRHLPDERRSITHKFSIAGHEGYITVGMYEDGTPGEIFITMAKEGSVISGLMDAFATAISLALQYGVPLEKLVEKFSYTRFQPSGFTNNPQIPVATSIVDYIFRWLGMKFLHQQPPQKQPLETLEEQPAPPAPSAAAQPETVGVTGAKEAPPSLTPTGQGETMDWSQLVKLQQDAPPCPVCGMIMVRAGACHQCLNCGSSYGCS
jgi:ribonucleoside-diphosphate reductase alpha chain